MANAKLEAVYRQLPSGHCPPGCGKCCGVIFPSLAEECNIKDFLQARGRPFHEFNPLEIGKDCPYLDGEKKCTIYPVRPFLCRALGVIQPMPCPLKLFVPARVLNPASADALYKAIYLHGKEKPRTEKHRLILREFLENEAKKHA